MTYGRRGGMCVLLVCFGNLCRSPMAAALTRELLGQDASVESAGTGALRGQPATPEAVATMKSRNLDISDHRSQPITDVDLGDFDLIVAMEPFVGQELLRHGADETVLRVLDIADPIGQKLDFYRATAQAIERELKALLD